MIVCMWLVSAVTSSLKFTQIKGEFRLATIQFG